jgi:hypothetical protein
MTTEEQEQAAELIDMLADIEARYPAVTPTLRDELAAMVEKLQTMYSSEVARNSMRVIGQTHVSLRDHQQRTDETVAIVRDHQRQTDATVMGVAEDMAGLIAVQDTANALAQLTAKALGEHVAQHVTEALDERLTRLEVMIGEKSRTVGKKT